MLNILVTFMNKTLQAICTIFKPNSTNIVKFHWIVLVKIVIA